MTNVNLSDILVKQFALHLFSGEHMFQKNMTIPFLLDFYGDILSERRREIMKMYYEEDLSLAEIADISGISRQGVRDSLKKSEAELIRLEETLGLSSRFEKLKSDLAIVLSELDTLLSSCPDDGPRRIAEDIKDKIQKLDI